MKPFIFLCVAMLSGCLHVQPIGPLADEFPQRPVVKEETVPEPVVRQAGKPTPPCLKVTPAEITAATAQDAVKRLQLELETDRRTLEAMPKYSEVSKVK